MVNFKFKYESLEYDYSGELMAIYLHFYGDHGDTENALWVYHTLANLWMAHCEACGWAGKDEVTAELATLHAKIHKTLSHPKE